MPRNPRENGILDVIEAGDTAYGVLDTLYNPTTVELYGELGFDFVWLDFEHAGPSPWDATQLENLLRAADATETDLLVRLPTPEPALVRKVLDAGVRNVFVSRVETADEVRAVVSASRFEYDGGPGQRGLGSPRASRWGLAMDDYASVEDAETVVGVTIENFTAVENLDDILSVPELGFVFAGPFDLSVAVGHPTDVDHEEVQEAVDTIRTKARERDVPVGGLTFGPEDAKRKAEQGYQILNLGSTTGALTSAFGDWRETFVPE